MLQEKLLGPWLAYEKLFVYTRFFDGTLLCKEKENCANEKLLSPWLA